VLHKAKLTIFKHNEHGVKRVKYPNVDSSKWHGCVIEVES